MMHENACGSRSVAFDFDSSFVVLARQALMWLYPDLTTDLEAANQEYVKEKNKYAKAYTQAVRDGDEAAKKSASAQKVYFQELDIGFKMSMALILTYDALKDNGG